MDTMFSHLVSPTSTQSPALYTSACQLLHFIPKPTVSKPLGEEKGASEKQQPKSMMRNCAEAGNETKLKRRTIHTHEVSAFQIVCNRLKYREDSIHLWLDKFCIIKSGPPGMFWVSEFTFCSDGHNASNKRPLSMSYSQDEKSK